MGTTCGKAGGESDQWISKVIHFLITFTYFLH